MNHMNIWAGQGDTVRFSNPNAGRDHDIEVAKRLLTLDKVYTVRKVEVSQSSSEVWLEGFAMPFNTVMFTDVKVDAERASFRADCWYSGAPDYYFSEKCWQEYKSGNSKNLKDIIRELRNKISGNTSYN